jgi:hypothetical protein
MYSLDINTSTYDIRLLVSRFGKKTGKTLKKTIKHTDINRMMKKLKKAMGKCDMEKLQLPIPV